MATDSDARWFDSHCHVHDARVNASLALDEARAAGVARFVDVGCDQPTSLAAIALAAEHDDVWATVGLHPHDSSQGSGWIDALLHDAVAQRIVAVGECGLDYHYDHSPREVQRAEFAAQIRLAFAHDLPLVIHTRSAWDDTFSVLADEGVPKATVFHCFTGGPEEAALCLALHDEVYLSFSGIVSFPTATELQAAASITPLSRLLVETDTPYLAPVPFRGKPNRPAWVPHVGQAVAKVKDMRANEVALASFANTCRAFRLAP
jgi:TatD DNase family protein